MQTSTGPVNVAVVLMSKYTGGVPSWRPVGGGAPVLLWTTVVVPGVETLSNVSPIVVFDVPVVWLTGSTVTFDPGGVLPPLRAAAGVRMAPDLTAGLHGSMEATIDLDGTTASPRRACL